MDPFFLERILPLFQTRRFRQGDKILTEGKPADALHVIYAGMAKVSLIDVTLNFVGVQAVLGERALSSDVPSAGDVTQEEAKCGASIVASTPLVITIALPKATLHTLLREDPVVQRKFEEQFDVEKRERGERTKFHAWRIGWLAFEPG